MAAEMISVPGLHAGVPYEYAAVVPAGRVVFTAGACPLDAEGRVVGLDDVEAQAQSALENLLVALAAAGAGPADIVKTTVYVAARDHAELVRAWNVVEHGLAPARPPSTLLGVAMLGYRGQLVELEAIAAPPDERGT
jgi:enamine deaminase RidA (YjgF/YER057c/UK114 family)